MKWVGGEVELVSLPNYGTDVYLNIPKIGDTEETVFAGNQIPGREGGWLLDRESGGGGGGGSGGGGGGFTGGGHLGTGKLPGSSDAAGGK